MSITLNKRAKRWLEMAIERGIISPESSSTPLLYDISRHWRMLLDATDFKSDNPGPWSEKEEAASEIIISAVTYLRHLGCERIEELLLDTIERHAKEIDQVS